MIGGQNAQNQVETEIFNLFLFTIIKKNVFIPKDR